MKKKILLLVGTRPNFIKITRFKQVFDSNYEVKIVHTGQHFDFNMADIFFKQLNIQPDYFLNIEAKSPNHQIAEIMMKLEHLMINEFSPDLLIVPGDVNSTLAGGITANKMGVKLAHLEAGLRSNDLSMPEEVNRIMVDSISDYLFVTEPSGIENLSKLNLKGEVFHVGNTMIDTLVKYSPKIDKSSILSDLKIENPFMLLTFHRPSNVDNKEKLLEIIKLLKWISGKLSIVLPIHPRTEKNIEKFGLTEVLHSIPNIIRTAPLGYFEFQKLIKTSQFVLTDSGGIQEETTYYQKPCLTIRDNTERPITCDLGSNKLLKFDVEKLKIEINLILAGENKEGQIPRLWDGRTTERILDVMSNLL